MDRVHGDEKIAQNCNVLIDRTLVTLSKEREVQLRKNGKYRKRGYGSIARMSR